MKIMRLVMLMLSFVGGSPLVLCPQPAQAMCELAIRQFEKHHSIPHNLLMAISHVESGRVIPGRGVVAWPWTINANGKPYVFATKSQAIAKVKQLQASGMRSIDVGCMQINLKHHPRAFSSLEEAFNPFTNIAYAARFLKQKKDESGSWQTAVAHYHSVIPSVNASYKKRVLKAWEKTHKNYPIDVAGSLSAPAVFLSKTLKHSGEVETQLKGENGHKIPVLVQFGPYTGLNRGTTNLKQGGKQEERGSYQGGERIPNFENSQKSGAGAISGGFFPISAVKEGGQASSHVASHFERAKSLGGVKALHGRYRIKKLPFLKGSKNGFFAIK